MNQESTQSIFPHRRPSFIRTLIEDARNMRFVRRYQLDQGDTESRPNQLADGTESSSVWLSNIDRLVKHCPPRQHEHDSSTSAPGQELLVRM